MSSDSELAPYEGLLAQAELELELAGRGEIEGLQELGPRWEELIAGIGEPAPPGAVALLERARLVGERARIELIRLREGLLVEHAAALHARRAADGYGRELQAKPQLERSA